MPDPSPRRVIHVGPAIGEVGGMASVLAVYVEQSVGADHLEVMETWSTRGVWPTACLWARCLGNLLRQNLDGVIVHAHASEGGSLLRKGAVLRAARTRGAATVVTLHGADFVADVARRPWLGRWALRAADTVVSLGGDATGASAVLVGTHRVVELPNPAIVPPRVEPPSSCRPVAIFAGELSHRKGLDVLAAAWPAVASAVPGCELVVVGPSAGETIAGPGVTLLPATDQRAVAQMIARSRVAVLPSRAEAMPMFLLEAMAAGRPFIGTPVGSVAELATHGGVLVDVGDADALAAALITLLTDDTEADRLGGQARAFVTETRSAPVVDGALRALYARALTRRARVATSSRTRKGASNSM